MIRLLTTIGAFALCAAPALAQRAISPAGTQPGYMGAPGVATALGTQDAPRNTRSYSGRVSGATFPLGTTAGGGAIGTSGYGAVAGYGNSFYGPSNAALGTGIYSNNSGIGTAAHVQAETPAISAGRNPSRPATAYGRSGYGSTMGSSYATGARGATTAPPSSAAANPGMTTGVNGNASAAASIPGPQ